MLFNSIAFLVFLPIVFIAYWFVFKQRKAQNIVILIASYYFYGCWDWRFLSLIILSTLVDYLIGIQLQKNEVAKKRKQLLWISILMNLGMLGVFKYYNFFMANWIELLNSLGIQAEQSSLHIILPVGISFYTFQTLSYTIDVYKKKLEPTKDLIAFASFVSFFPQLVAGPIERASNLLPQFHKNCVFDYEKAASGIRLMIWGFFKKIVVADNCALIVNNIFENYETASGSTLLLGLIFFGFQIYGDFSGYSNIAIGVARLFGFDLMRNFMYPYFSRDIAEFWRRWHISLTTWFRDYLYIPLGGSRGGKYLKVRNVCIIFLVSGFWHGANWTYILWGALNAVFILPIVVYGSGRNRTTIVAENSWFPTIKETLQMLATFGIVTLTWIFFRAESVTDSFKFAYRLFDISNFGTAIQHKKVILFLAIFMLLEWISRKEEVMILLQGKYRHFFYVLLTIIIVYFASAAEQTSFIYFQF
ncbi:MBOAT family O-acyltransferase [Kordia zhangzhouensis]|uniref:MBOAT family O-acyltransferase n=1 Tax=Kordia zhangzhouensis TaxID=1620405 RepID=UPI0006294851|nr:MBOAT family O-acyltransferase [Kordia zhangzhouensis]